MQEFGNSSVLRVPSALHGRRRAKTRWSGPAKRCHQLSAELPCCHSYHTVITGRQRAVTSAGQVSARSSPRQPAHPGPNATPALGTQEKPDPKAMPNRDIFTVRLGAQLKLCFATTLPRWLVVLYGSDSKVTQNGARGKGRAHCCPQGPQPQETEVFSEDTSCCPHPPSPTGRTGSEGQPGLKGRGCTRAARQATPLPSLKCELQLNPLP